MKGISLLVAACTSIIACSDKPNSDASPTGVNSRPTYVLFGTVRDSAGVPVAGADAQIVRGAYAGRTAVSNQSGNFAFVGVSGTLVVSVSKYEYELYQKTLDIRADTAINVIMGRYNVSDTIQLGRTIRATVFEGAAPCDPVRWDARAPCRRFYFTPSSPGALFIEIKWDGLPELDATIVNPADEYVTSSSQSGSNRIIMSASLIAGVKYEVRVNSYYSAQTFDLTATFAR
jgi:hypothetical protein